MANEFIIRNGFQSRGNGQVTGSLDVTGDTIISGSLTVKGTAVPSTGETLQSWYVSDSDAVTSLINATTTDGTFVPTIKSTQPAADNFTPFSWINEIGADTGTFPGLIFQVRSGSNQTVQNRDLFAFRNYTTDIVNIGTSTTTFNSSLVISGSMTYRTETVSSVADPTLSSLSHVVFYDTSGGAGGTITLPTAVSGKEILLIRTVGTNGATVSGGGGNINGSATQALPTTLYTTVKLISDGTNWFANTLTAL